MQERGRVKRPTWQEVPCFASRYIATRQDARSAACKAVHHGDSKPRPQQAKADASILKLIWAASHAPQRAGQSEGTNARLVDAGGMHIYISMNHGAAYPSAMMPDTDVGSPDQGGLAVLGRK